MTAPLDRIESLLDEHVLRVTRRETPIPSVAARAAAAARSHPALVRGDIGQIIGVDADLEVLYGPPVGLEPLRAAIAELYARTFGIAGLGAANVTVCTGAAEALSLLFRCFARGKKVGLPRGGWDNYDNGVLLAGGEPVTLDFFDSRGALDLEGIARVVRGEELAVLVANFPQNPTGAVLDEAEARALAALAVDTGVVMIADEVYARLRYDGVAPQSLLGHAPGHVVSVGSASKEYLMPGARVGYVVTARPALSDDVLRKVLRAASASPSVLGQQRLLPLIEADVADARAGREPALLAKIRRAMHERRDAMLAVLCRHGMQPVGRAHHQPEGTIFLMAALPPWWSGDDATFASEALARGCFSCIPGSAFGLPGAVRFSYGATSLDDVDRLDAQLAALRATIA